MWPVLRTYDQNHLARIALPIGGIGTGTISLGGRGDLRDWEIMNHPAKGYNPGSSFFAVNIQSPDGHPVTRALEGQIDPANYEGGSGCPIPNHGLPRFRQCNFEAAYPLGQVLLSDPDIPIDVRLQAFNPLIPANPDLSGIPCGVFRYVLRNLTDQLLNVSVCSSLSNFTCHDPAVSSATSSNINEFHQSESFQGLMMLPGGKNDKSESYGSLALVTTAQTGVSYKTFWEDRGWGSGLLFFWEDFRADGILEETRLENGKKMPRGSLAVRIDLPPHETRSVTFVICWHFPNRYTWTPSTAENGAQDSNDKNWIGNYYTTQYKDAWDVAEKVIPQLQLLEDQTLDFVDTFCSSSIPDVVKESALFNLSTLRSQTCFRTPDGKFFGWEGCNDQKGCCHGSCTHVWNYEQATAFLFGSLARTMRETEFGPAIREDGCMSFRVNLPLERGREFSFAAADGQMGCLMKLYRDWQTSGDDDLLYALWPNAKKALSFAWLPGGWDADQDGVMEGCQHNTMDIEYFGPNPEIETWYLGALRAGQEMAKYLGDTAFAEKCEHLFTSGKDWTDHHLFNGEYYEHQIVPIVNGYQIPPSLLVGMGAMNLSKPDYQLGEGCLIDQLVGQYMAHICGLGYLLDPEHISQALASILKYNRRDSFQDHFNCLRSYVLNDETAILIASYPKGRPENPFPYFSEAWTGLEYVAAVGLFYEGQYEEGVRCYRDTRNRYDGFRRNPFDEAECGHHYARAMASWAGVLAIPGFHYSGVTKRMTFSNQPGQFFWSNGYAWGKCTIKKEADSFHIELMVKHGELKVDTFELKGIGEVKSEVPFLTSKEHNILKISIQSQY